MVNRVGPFLSNRVTSQQLWPMIPKLGMVAAFKPRDMGQVSVVPGDIPKIAEATNGIPLFVEVHMFNQLVPFIEIVKEADIKAFFVVHCATPEQGKQAIDRVRALG